MAREWLVSILSHDQAGAVASNTICVHDNGGTGGVDPAGATELLNEVDTWLTTSYRAILPTSSVLDRYHAFQIPDEYGAETITADKTKSVNGTLGPVDGKLPREMVGLLALRTNSTSRRKQGRLFLPSPEHGTYITSTGTWVTTAGVWPLWIAFADKLIAGHDFDTDNHLSTRIYSRRQHAIGTGDKTTDVDSYALRERPKWLRRRESIP